MTPRNAALFLAYINSGQIGYIGLQAQVVVDTVDAFDLCRFACVVEVIDPPIADSRPGPG